MIGNIFSDYIRMFDSLLIIRSVNNDRIPSQERCCLIVIRSLMKEVITGVWIAFIRDMEQQEHGIETGFCSRKSLSPQRWGSYHLKNSFFFHLHSYFMFLKSINNSKWENSHFLDIINGELLMGLALNFTDPANFF